MRNWKRGVVFEWFDRFFEIIILTVNTQVFKLVKITQNPSLSPYLVYKNKNTELLELLLQNKIIKPSIQTMSFGKKAVFSCKKAF